MIFYKKKITLPSWVLLVQKQKTHLVPTTLGTPRVPISFPFIILLNLPSKQSLVRAESFSPPLSRSASRFFPVFSLCRDLAWCWKGLDISLLIPAARPSTDWGSL
jgi:hypothetical protein